MSLAYGVGLILIYLSIVAQFTATSMTGIIALDGMIVINLILIVKNPRMNSIPINYFGRFIKRYY